MMKETRWLRTPWLALPMTTFTPVSDLMMLHLRNQPDPPAAIATTTRNFPTAARPTLLRGLSTLKLILLGRGSPPKCERRQKLQMCKPIRLLMSPRRLRLQPLHCQQTRLLQPRRRLLMHDLPSYICFPDICL